jgi:hypothetical protein
VEEVLKVALSRQPVAITWNETEIVPAAVAIVDADADCVVTH